MLKDDDIIKIRKLIEAHGTKEDQEALARIVLVLFKFSSLIPK